jgi:hypothetical protein
METVTLNWQALNVLLPALTVCVIFCIIIYRIEKTQKLENKLRARTITEIYRAVEKVDYHGHIPPVAVERFMSYLQYPDPSFDAESIIRQELNNQRGGPVGSALSDGENKC